MTTDLVVEASEADSSAPPSDRSARERTTTSLLEDAAATTDEIARRRMIEEVVVLNMGPARRMAQRYAHRGVPVDDLTQVAYVALVHAARNFDPHYGSDFMSYAAPCIRGELRKHFRDHAWAVRPSRWVQELQPRLQEARELLHQQLGRSPRPREIAHYLGEDEERVIEALSATGCFAPTSLDRPVTQDEGASTLAELLPAEDDEWQAVEARVILEPLVARLDERDQRIVQLRFGEERTQQEIADEIGVTQMHVSRLIKRILAELRDQLDAAPSAVS